MRLKLGLKGFLSSGLGGFSRLRKRPSEYGQGSWALIDDVVMLKTAFGQKATQRGDSPPETIARILLYELSGEQRPEVD